MSKIKRRVGKSELWQWQMLFLKEKKKKRRGKDEH